MKRENKRIFVMEKPEKCEIKELDRAMAILYFWGVGWRKYACVGSVSDTNDGNEGKEEGKSRRMAVTGVSFGLCARKHFLIKELRKQKPFK